MADLTTPVETPVGTLVPGDRYRLLLRSQVDIPNPGSARRELKRYAVGIFRAVQPYAGSTSPQDDPEEVRYELEGSWGEGDTTTDGVVGVVPGDVLEIEPA